MKKPTVYVLLACIVVMVVFFIALERTARESSVNGCMNFEIENVQIAITPPTKH